MTETRDHLEDTITCPKCDAINFRGARICAECSTIFDPDAIPAEDEAALTAKREASAALREGYGWIARVTWLFRSGVIAYGIVTLFAVVALRKLEVPQGAGILVVALSTLLTVLMLMGAIQILFHPFASTLAVAVLASLVTIAHLLGPNPLGVMFLWSAAWAVAFWVAVVPMLRFRRLMATHMDLYITHHASRQTKNLLEGRSPKQRHERLMSAMHRASRRAWTISAVAAVLVCLVSTFGTYAVVSLQRPESLEAALAEFENAWNGGRMEAVNRLFISANRKQQSIRLASLVEGHGWRRTALPKLKGGKQRREGPRLWVDYEVKDITLAARWALLERRWHLVQIKLPLPSCAPNIKLLLDAWRDSDPKAIAEMFSAGKQKSMLESIERAMKRREWDRLPKVMANSTVEDEDGKVIQTLVLEKGEVTVRWYFRTDGKWGPASILFPKL